MGMNAEYDSSDDLVRRHVFCSGRVQNVGFRYFVLRKASALGVSGWVRNLSDGRVEAIFEGPADAVAKAVEWCRIGPPHGEVRNVQVRKETPQGDFDSFSIR
jgi:acylphosphatase